ncbi:protein kinase, partial [Bacillus thuringiensis]|nr:protein kinase [Bacillus thuringiensis]
KICDFGFIKGESTKDLSQTYCGSKSYAAPEILLGRPYDPRKSDIWALGVIIYIYVTGKMPFDETKGTKSILEEQRVLDFHWP